MNDLSFFARSALLTSVFAAFSALGTSVALAQTPNTVIRQADFIVAVVNSEVLTNQEVQTLRQRLTQEAAAKGINTSPDELTRQAVEQLIIEKAQLQLARDSGIKIDDQTLEQTEQTVATNNQITREELFKRLQQEGISPSAFREQLRQQLMITRLREREVDGRIRISDLEIEQFLQDKLKSQAAQVPPQLQLGMILIAVPENSAESDTRALAERATEVERRARSGENFAELAKTFSQTTDRGANGGDMGMRSIERYPDLFIEATRELKVGEVSAPVRSAAGFHVLKVLDRLQTNDQLLVTQTRARHILLRLSEQLSQAQAMTRLNRIREDVVSGKADFAAVAREISQDGSAQQGGDLGWANPGMFVPEFEQVMNQLRPGQVGEPLVSRFGVHLIEVTDRRNAPMSDQDQRTMARNALREKKLEEAYAAWVEELRGRAYVEMREPPQ